MRLTHIKLAGFKSFVDPTTIHVHGQRVGVVGPNGCGKSNVMESVRWVLGESSAKEMRADAMDAVIFNGSANRKPISRASVELLFDNSLGGAAGEWGQYAEISVKRVIEREKGSAYFINNTAVRRRDVADLFLGTGLGGRAYAIIGQNTISRIVEAKPEELRIFLEEAAGISKYKERRRETEFRLRDTRENLMRVEDICREMQKQINKLETQAVVAEQYHRLQADLKLAEGQLWLLKKRDAGRDWEKAKALVERLTNDLEAKIAELRAAESTLESTRQNHYAASEGINTAQAAYYEANADVSNLENQVRQNTEARERLSQQLQQIHIALERNLAQSQALQQQQQAMTTEAAEAEKLESAANVGLRALQAGLPEKQSGLNTANQQLEQAQHALSEARQQIQLAQSRIHYTEQSLAESQHRIARLETDLTNLKLPEQDKIVALEESVARSRADIGSQEQALKALQTEEGRLHGLVQELRQQQSAAQREVSQAEAEIAALSRLQQSLNQSGKLGNWLQQAGLGNSTRLWQTISIAPEWSTALEAALGARLNAIVKHTGNLKDRPPAALTLGFDARTKADLKQNPALTSLLGLLEVKDASLQAVLQDWLAHVYVMDKDAAAQAQKLQPGEWLVTMEGDVYTRHSVFYHAAQANQGAEAAMHGVLARQQQLDAAKQQLPKLQQQAQQATDLLRKNEMDWQALRPKQQQLQSELGQLNSTVHRAQLELNQLKQARDNAIERQQHMQTETANQREKMMQLQTEKTALQSALQTNTASLAELEQAKNQAHSAKQQSESIYFALRDEIQQAEKKQQACFYNKKIISNNINELNNKVKLSSDEKESLTHRQKENEEALKVAVMDTLKTNLAEALTKKQTAEQKLAEARNLLAEQDMVLQAQERLRMQTEQALHPIRDALEQSRLKEQETRIYFEQCQAALLENGLDEKTLDEGLDADARASDLQRRTTQLSNQINALGPVNLVAIQELATEKGRKIYLDSQMQDLLTASETLEDAIRNIDRETRGKLQATFDEANRNFDELFKVLFNGGQAKLELLGDEILDTGIQVSAQPPGKKNTTIQMLSGGEKALTAMALVFALFRLNPAPFCLMDEVDAPLDDSNTERFCSMVKKMAEKTQFLFVSHNKITMEMAQQLIGVTMQESGVSRVVDVDIEAAIQMQG